MLTLPGVRIQDLIKLKYEYLAVYHNLDGRTVCTVSAYEDVPGSNLGRSNLGNEFFLIGCGLGVLKQCTGLISVLHNIKKES